MAPVDPHSYTDSTHPFTRNIHLNLFLDFKKKIIHGIVTLELNREANAPVFLDTRDLTIFSVHDSHKSPLEFSLESHQDPSKGRRLTVHPDSSRPTKEFTLSFATSPSSSALQWLDPSQTSNSHAFVYTQCQAIHARSIFPCQDTPSARFTYTARLNIPKEMKAVMSAAHEKTDAQDGRAVEIFTMQQPIPPYLFAFAVGDLVYEDLGRRSSVYGLPDVIKSAAYEFSSTEQMLEQAEKLFGPYDWERFDLLVLPPSFPYGGMENPRMVFLSPTVIVGDTSGVQVVAHELAHSWTGNLITNASANDFWLNEGFTTYAERRIVEVLDGEERVALHLGLGWNGLEEEVERFKDRPEFTKLKTNQENVDPDEVYSQVPFEKGCFFIRRLEAEVTRPVFDEFLKAYINKFRFQSLDTETFVDFLKGYFPGIEKKVDLDVWIYQPGIPSDAIKPQSKILDQVQSFVKAFPPQESVSDWKNYLESWKQEAKQWQAIEWQVFLESLPKKVSHEALRDMNEAFHLSTTPNWDIRVAFLVLAAYSGFKDCYADIENALLMVGRMKYLRSLYSGLLESRGARKDLAKAVFAKARSKYHPIAQSVVEGLMNKHESKC